ncbi:TetR/AcrR family transcriptional regulator [Antrihabitans sp. YC2-6]|uniref:TetR/AcrR family transcriptional regulator n=1 Tax=Antrihabitans sp. YC2-6 TaxID=2799498 RepID=UPI0018F32D39|nr:TetR/AcrR family transcriptional regulator [Antrihabitans sp. YC2-6]MBJ8348646.1 TetR/AcrR family transcriptional regulator [Antrihabitans sp. YC2-6]
MSRVESDGQRRRGRPAGPPVDPAQRREELLDAAERVIERGVREPTFAEIAAEAGYARTAVYAAFADRGELAKALGRRHTDRLLAAADHGVGQANSMREMISGTIQVVCEFVETCSDLYPLVMQMIVVESAEHAQRPLFSEIADWASSILEGAMKQVGVDPAAARTWAAAIAGATLLAAEDWNIRRDRSREQLVDEITDLVWPGLAAVGLGAVVGPVQAVAQ